MGELVTINLRHLARGLGVPLRQVQSVVDLLDEGNTVPFITRYRKDQTGGLDDEQIRQIQARLLKMRLLGERKQTILRSIESQGRLTEELASQIHGANTTKRLEDLYLPYKPKKQTLATTARSRGLEPLAEEILQAAASCADLDARAADFVNPDRQVPSAADAVLGAGHILAERFSEMAELRQQLREILQRTGRIMSAHVSGEKFEGSRKPEAGDRSRQVTAAMTEPSEMVVMPPVSALGVESLDTELLVEAVAETEVVAPEASDGALGETFLTQADAVSPQELERRDAPLDIVEPTDPPESSGEGGGEGEESPESEESRKETSSEAAPSDPPAASIEASAKVEAAPVGERLLEAPETLETDGQGTVSPPEEVTEEKPTEVVAETAEAGAAPAETAAPPTTEKTVRPQSASKKKKRSRAEQNRRKEMKKKKAEERLRKAFSDYFSYSEEIRKIPPHRVLAINRGERAKVLRVRIEADLEAMYRVLDEVCVPPEHPHAEFLRGCARDALTRLILPSLEREARRELTEKAELHAVQVFARNLRNLLLQPPVRGRRVLAVDPGFKSGCKVAALDEFGNVLAHDIVYMIGKPEQKQETRQTLHNLMERYQLAVVVIGNGTGCRDAEDLVAALIAEDFAGEGVSYVIVNEAGASVYSASRVGRDEFPDYDASLRGAISIGRRLQDPLSELVKIDAANIGVGLYQHDVKAKHLQTSLDEVVESCVNYVGVEVNTASPALLRYVSGLNQLTARRLYEHRMQNGPFRSREQLREVAGFGEATFVQAAGFLKIVGGDNPLDATWIHPESYSIAARVLEKLTASQVATRDASGSLTEKIAQVNVAELANELSVGELTLKDILSQLARPGRDPREDLPPPVFKQGVLKLEDLTPGMELTGTVLNVVDFGAFVDIGMHDSGLVHVSRLADRFVRDPHEVVTVGDIVRVWVVDVDKQRRRVSLTMIAPGKERAAGQRLSRSEESSQSQRPRHDRHHRRPQGRGAPRQTTESRPPFKPRAKPKVVPPITEEMKAGKEPMRSFSDLAQFFQVRDSDDDEEASKDENKKK